MGQMMAYSYVRSIPAAAGFQSPGCRSTRYGCAGVVRVERRPQFTAGRAAMAVLAHWRALDSRCGENDGGGATLGASDDASDDASVLP